MARFSILWYNTYMKALTLSREGKYVYRYSPICFNGKGESAPQRTKDEIDAFDKVFDSKEDFTAWHRDLTIGLAELDEVMNYCEYFERSNGNDGFYIREGKRFPVKGTWTGYEINCEHMLGFKNFLIENGWLKYWFKLMKRYATTQR